VDANFDPQFQTISYEVKTASTQDESKASRYCLLHHEGRYSVSTYASGDCKDVALHAEGLMLIPAFRQYGDGNEFDTSQYGNIWKEDFGSAAPSRAVKDFNLGCRMPILKGINGPTRSHNTRQSLTGTNQPRPYLPPWFQHS